MTELKEAIKFEIEECVKFQVYIPPLVMPDGRKLKLGSTTGSIQGVLPPIDFLVPDPENNNLVKARFHATEMRWEIIE